MAISYPLALPQTRTELAISLRMRDAIAVSESPFAASDEVQEWPRDQWRASVELRPFTEPDARLWIGWLASLRGRRGTFLMGDPLRRSPRGIGTGTPLVMGAGQTGLTLITDGWTISQTGILKAGDYIQLGSAGSATLHMVVADADSNFSGQATLEIWPRLRTTPSDNAAITVTNPVGRWRLASNERGWDVRSAQIYGIRFDCVEDLA